MCRSAAEAQPVLPMPPAPLLPLLLLGGTPGRVNQCGACACGGRRGGQAKRHRSGWLCRKQVAGSGRDLEDPRKIEPTGAPGRSQAVPTSKARTLLAAGGAAATAPRQPQLTSAAASRSSGLISARHMVAERPLGARAGLQGRPMQRRRGAVMQGQAGEGGVPRRGAPSATTRALSSEFPGHWGTRGPAGALGMAVAPRQMQRMSPSSASTTHRQRMLLTQDPAWPLRTMLVAAMSEGCDRKSCNWAVSGHLGAWEVWLTS